MFVRAQSSRWRLVPSLCFGVAIGLASSTWAGPPPPKASGTGDTAKKGAAAAPPSPAPPSAKASGAAGGSSSAAPSGTPPAKPPAGSVPPAPSGKPDAAGTTPAPEPERPPVDLSDTWSRSRGGSSSSPRYVRNPEQRVEIANPEGYYSGVSVEGNHVPPFPAAKMGTKPALLTWTGFERTSAGSRVFFEVSAAVATKLSISGSTLTLRLANTKINVKNNTRNLDLRYFKTPVSSVKVKRAGKDTIATIVLKRGAEPKLSTIDGKAGYKLVVLEFGDGTAVAPTPPP